MRESIAVIVASVVKTTGVATVSLFLINNAFSTVNRLLTPNMYWWCHKTLVTTVVIGCNLEWMASVVSPFWPQKMN